MAIPRGGIVRPRSCCATRCMNQRKRPPVLRAQPRLTHDQQTDHRSIDIKHNIKPTVAGQVPRRRRQSVDGALVAPQQPDCQQWRRRRRHHRPRRLVHQPPLPAAPRDQVPQARLRFAERRLGAGLPRRDVRAAGARGQRPRARVGRSRPHGDAAAADAVALREHRRQSQGRERGRQQFWWWWWCRCWWGW